MLFPAQAQLASAIAVGQERVRRLVLLCPGFDLADRWPAMLGAATMARWERDGVLSIPDGSGVPFHFRGGEHSTGSCQRRVAWGAGGSAAQDGSRVGGMKVDRK